MARLRSEKGCPWDREQTLKTLRPFLIEEAYEVLEAIDTEQPQAHCEELGDLLFQIIFQCRLAQEKGWFDLFDVIDTIARKIQRRHPHVFGKETATTPQQVITTWERVKKEEKQSSQSTRKESVLDGLPQTLPAMLAAHRLSERAARVGFDWQNAEQVMAKVREELAELEEVLAGPSREPEKIQWEIGDLLFALANLARHLGWCSEDLLREANRRFAQRFCVVEQLADERGISMTHASIDTLEALWQEAKARE